MTTLSGFIERITYYNEENGFVVAKLQEKGRTELTTIVGNLAALNVGESLKVTGEWVFSKKFGEQFQVETCEITVPATIHGIRKYLGSGIIKGVGPVLADRIVDQFGLDTLGVIEMTPSRLSEVEGIGPKRIDFITRAWEEQKGIKEIMIFLQGHGVSPAYSAKIYKQYGHRSIEVVKENPYRLARDMHGIGFITADKIARNLGVDLNSLIRAKAGLLYVLSQLTEEGHVYYPKTELIQRAKEILKVDRGVIVSAVDDLEREKDVFIERINEDEDPPVYLAPLFVSERGVAQRLTGLNRSPSIIRPIHPEKAIEWVQQKLRIELAGKQKEAVLMAARSKVLVITGGPGTGKTTIINAIMRIFQELKLKIILGAPTGRAAKRMSEATGWEAKTIHRLLEYTPRKGVFKKRPDDPLEADVLIIDETSMVDIVLMYHLLQALPERAHLILVGDVDQLPSVGPGNVLRDIIDSGSFAVVRLTEIFRQAQESMIVVNAHRINEGEFPILGGRDEKSKADFLFLEEEDPGKVVSTVLSLCSNTIPRRFGFHPFKEIQVMTPMHRGVIGVANLNLEIQKTLNHDPRGVTVGNRLFKPGDKVMQIVNNYDREVFNGDIGWISEIHEENKELVIDFDGRRIDYDFTELDELVLAYAISVHKSQGSEYPAIIMPVTTQHYILLQRNLLYTAVTRAKKLAVLVGTKKALGIAIGNNKPQMRHTMLARRLQTRPV